MKQIVLLADFDQWKEEADFATDVLHLAATRVVTVNIGPRTLNTDLNLRDLRRLFSSKTRAESIGIAIKKLYSQGVADGILCFVGSDPNFFAIHDAAFTALPYGMPKAAVTTGDSLWQSGWDVIRFCLPGQNYNLNPVIKIALSNAVFAISGMALSNIHNFGSAQPTIAAYCGAAVGKAMMGLGVNFLALAKEEYLPALVAHGYVDGLMLSRECRSMETWVEIASLRGVPIVLVCKNPGSIRAVLKPLSPSSTPVLIVSPCETVSTTRLAATKSSALWPPHQSIPYRYGTRLFYWHAAKALLRLLG